jgi:two-component system OmpR family sensor kinase
VAPDIAWAVFAGLNLAAMRLFPAWQTVPFLAIWVSLTVIYGFRLWRMQPTMLTLAAVTVATGGIIGVQVIKGQQDADYLAEVPLIALMFLVMVLHGRRRLAATAERLTAMEQVQQISQENLRLLEQQRQFLVDASHELGTPITVALGHAELIEQAVTDQAVAADARVVAGELARLRRLTNRLLLLASAGTPGFLQVAPVATDSLVLDALERWGHVPRHWRLGEAAEATVAGDADRLVVALDALLENAVAHTEPGDRIEVSVRLENGNAVIAVTDSGCGIPPADLERIFGRFTRAEPYRSREAGGFGLGLAIVQAIAEAHHGSVRVHSTSGQGATFEMVIPAVPEPAQKGCTAGRRAASNMAEDSHGTWTHARVMAALSILAVTTIAACGTSVSSGSGASCAAPPARVPTWRRRGSRSLASCCPGPPSAPGPATSCRPRRGFASTGTSRAAGRGS